ncbi:MAG: copper-binding protein [Methylophilaceae bacterium]|nr:copper-binding protein [Methylophilaceae bacterium]
MKPSQITLSILTCIVLGLAPPAAAMGEMPMSDHHTSPAAVTKPTEADVRKVYLDTGKVTLKHDEIKNLEMPAMTMQFLVKEKAMLKGIVAGDKVLFTAEMVSGEIVVTSITKRKP